MGIECFYFEMNCEKKILFLSSHATLLYFSGQPPQIEATCAIWGCWCPSGYILQSGTKFCIVVDETTTSGEVTSVTEATGIN